MKYISVFMLIFSIIISGCATTPEPTPSSTPEPTTCSEVDDPCVEVIFKEDRCIYHGPSVLPEGTAYIQFHNQRDERARMGVWNLMEGKTIQGFQEMVGDEPSSAHHNPPWVTGMGTASIAGPGRIILRRENYLPGIYVLDCFMEDPYQLWFGGGFTVE